MTAFTRRVDLRALSACVALVLAAGGCATSKSAPPVGSYASPKLAMQALADAVGTGNKNDVEMVLGPGSEDILSSGDPVADRKDAEWVRMQIEQKMEFETYEEGFVVALLGPEAWPFPIPLVSSSSDWRFDADAGRNEILNRRIGRNELSTIASLHAYVDAQREYVSEGRDGHAPAYAQHLLSQPGKHDGLCWEVEPGEAQSPLGPLVAQAALEGYPLGNNMQSAYHGYMYRILLAQGPNAPGGAKQYVDASGNMTRGFAALAWPAMYANSGVMTFLVSERGIVYQKDLGAGTEGSAAAITTFDPDMSWTPTGD